jgi:hypothetical protein
MMGFVLLWIGMSALVGFLGRHRSVGPWGFFAFSLIFTPIVGALSLFVAGPGRRPAAMQPTSHVLDIMQINLQALQQQQQQLRELSAGLAELRAAVERAQPVDQLAVARRELSH